MPVFVDVDRDTYQIDVDADRGRDRPAHEGDPRAEPHRQLPRLGPNPRRSPTATASQVVEDSCDCLGATLRGTPTGTRSDISLTSFALSHIITAAGTGGMVCVDDPALLDRALLLRRWGRRSEVKLFGSKKGDKRFFSELDGLEYDDLFIFDEVGWNFEPSEISAAFGVVQMRKLPHNLARRKRNFALLHEHFARHEDVFVLPRTHARRRHRLAHVPDHDPAGVRCAPRCVPAAHGGVGCRHPHGVDGQRDPAARVRERWSTGSRRAASRTPIA